jgi:hypothetical protein
MKAKSLTLLLSHYATGHYREIRQYHNGLHRIELHAMVPHIYHSQDFVAPPRYMAARHPTTLKLNGGECLSLYWSEGPPEDLDQDVRAIMAQNRAQGLIVGPGGQELTYRKRMHVLGARLRPGLDVLPDMVPMLPNTGVVVSLREFSDGGEGAGFVDWHESVYVPQVLQPDVYSAAFTLRSMDPADQRIAAHLYFVDTAEPLEAFDAAERVYAANAQSAEMSHFIFSGVFQPVVDGHDPYE